MGAAWSWTPPDGMPTDLVTSWRKFYSAAYDKYRITPERYLQLYRLQKGRCCICQTATGKHPLDPRGRGSRRLGIDHNHMTGQVRGLLCTGGDKTCNRVIGWLNASSLRRAAAYLEGSRTPGLMLERVDFEIADMLMWSQPPVVPIVPGKDQDNPIEQIWNRS